MKNPIASDQELLRYSLLPGIWKNVLENSKRWDAFRLFEIGLEIHQQNNQADLPQEIPHLMAALYERQGDGSAGLFEMKRVAECILPGAKACPAEAYPYEHPVRSANIVWRGAPVGRIFELHPGLVKAGRAGILDAYRTGRGSIRMRARAQIEETRTGSQIVITELPYQASPATIQTKIAELVNSRELDGIRNIDDLSAGESAGDE